MKENYNKKCFPCMTGEREKGKSVSIFQTLSPYADNDWIMNGKCQSYRYSDKKHIVDSLK